MHIRRILALTLAASPLPMLAQQFDASLYEGMRWRQIGPFRAGRVSAVAGVPGVREAKVNIVWDPPWDPSRMSDEARTVLNMW